MLNGIPAEAAAAHPFPAGQLLHPEIKHIKPHSWHKLRSIAVSCVGFGGVYAMHSKLVSDDANWHALAQRQAETLLAERRELFKHA
eukprot:2136264-Rhodomonas_salina.1